jgi:hypothetical protein
VNADKKELRNYNELKKKNYRLSRHFMPYSYISAFSDSEVFKFLFPEMHPHLKYAVIFFYTDSDVKV